MDLFQLAEIQKNMIVDAKLQEAMARSGGRQANAVMQFLMDAYWGDATSKSREDEGPDG